jgi:hypothetical protein
LQLREKTGKTRSIFDVDLDVEQIDSWEIWEPKLDQNLTSEIFQLIPFHSILSIPKR